MKILGIGVDLVSNSRIQQFVHKSYSGRFFKKFLHSHEILYFSNIRNERQRVEYLASRWAIKEALNKAIGRKELYFSDIRITRDDNGQPMVEIEGDDNERLLLELQINRWHVSVSHEGEYTLGTAIVEQYPL